jgi:hypothetical protein
VTGLNRGDKHRNAAMVCIVLGVLLFFLSYAFVKAAHHVNPNAQPHAPMHDQK